MGVGGDRIRWLGGRDEQPPPAARTYRADGRVAAPGFIDVHNHSDLSPILMPEMPSALRQGVTTVIVGNCGFSPWPLAGFEEGVRLAYGDPVRVARPRWSAYSEYLDALEQARPALNIATLVGHGSIRRQVMGLDRRIPSPEQLAAMRKMVAEAVDSGAHGLSTGLIYVPGIFSKTEELVTLAEEASRFGGIYTSHIRGEGEHVFGALDEALEVGGRAEIPVHVSHLKCESAGVWGLAERLLERIHDAPDATADQYPYTAWNSSLESLLPPWAPVADAPLLDMKDRERLRTAVEHGEPGFQSAVEGVGWDRIVIESSGEGRWNGTDVATIADALQTDPFDVFLELLADDPNTSCIGHAMREDDVFAILSDPEVFVASDASAIDPEGLGGDQPVHPRSYGTFPRALQLARDRKLLALENIVRKMTSLPSDRFGLEDRGRIEAGARADLVVFEPAAVEDRATFEAPHAYPEGMDLVVVNGVVAWDADSPTSIERAGRVLRRGA